VPRNVHIVGAMNTADRSIKLLDAALRRRFAFIELMPEPAALHGGEIGGLDLEVFLETLNERIARIEGREKQIGHSYLLDAGGQPISDPAEFSRRFRHEILPLLQEYAYEDYGELRRYLGPGIVDSAGKRLRTDVLKDHDKLIGQLVTSFMQQDVAQEPSAHEDEDLV
jgi:5-methylcytosine-specific restriction enzyme B